MTLYCDKTSITNYTDVCILNWKATILDSKGSTDKRPAWRIAGVVSGDLALVYMLMAVSGSQTSMVLALVTV